MNELEATEAKLKCLKMVEGTNLKWWDVVRYEKSKQRFSCFIDFDCCELALGIVEGKPVWKGDELYYDGADKILSSCPVLIDGGHNLLSPRWSWNPPKPTPKALSAFEQADLQKERDELYDALSAIMSSVYAHQYIRLNILKNTETILAKYYKGTL